MHIILGILGTVVTILVLLNKLQDAGMDIGWLNPFSWRRRRKFRKQYELSPAYALQSPMEVAALFMVAVAKVDGDMSKEQKERILQLFQSEFKLSEEDAANFLAASVHIYGRGEEVLSNPKYVVSRSQDAFTEEQVSSVISMLHEVSKAEGYPSLRQESLIDKIIAVFPQKQLSKW